MSSSSRPNPSAGKNTPNRKTGAKRERSSRQKLTGWLEQHVEACADALNSLRTQALNTFMSLVVVAIALLLPALVYVAGKNMAQFGDSLQNTNRISFYLEADITADSVQTLQQAMQNHPLIDRVEFVSSQQAAADFTTWSGLGDVISSLGNNPLPASLEVHPNNMLAETALQIRDAFAASQGVEQVVMDTAWIERLESLMRLTDRMVFALILVLSLAVLFIIGNAIRTHIAGRNAEIRVMTLIGATRSFIARPFLYSGALQGMFGAALAWIFLQGLLSVFRGPAHNLLAFYGDQYQFIGMDLVSSLLLVAGGMILGWIGAGLSVSRHLNQY
ncbi:MAG: permease-like cell division protein FtsX [Pseudohongiella sp.]|nr:permease-like cell division protein FtsX [Pseudohongiella sp.]